MAVDAEPLTSEAPEERRRAASERRRSWASSQPFEADLPPNASQMHIASARRAQWQRPLRRAAMIGDFLIAASAVVMTAFSLHLSTAAPQFRLALLPGLVAAVLWVVVVSTQGGYQVRQMGSGPEEFQSILRSAGIVIAVLGISAYATQVLLPRRYVFVTVPLVALACAVWRYSLRRYLHARRRRGTSMLRTIIVGTPGKVSPVAADLSADPHHGYQIVGSCAPYFDVEAYLPEIPTLGTISDIPQVVVDHDIDVVIVAGSELSGPALRRLSWALERAGAQLVVAPGLVEVAGPHVSLRPTAGLSLVHLEVPSRHLGRGLGKAILDKAMGFAMLAVATPIIAGAALLVRITSPGPAFFSQTRAGLDGRPFTMWKLRSMVVDAEARRDELLAQSDRDGLMFKMHADPRITPVGKVLRRFSIDELPQLWNVVRGDMSLVGPRPPLMSEYENYHDAVNRRLRVKPGLTGLWQVSGRADLSWDQSVNLDLRYVDNWSLAMDMLILWKTLRVVVFGSGAY